MSLQTRRRLPRSRKNMDTIEKKPRTSPREIMQCMLGGAVFTMLVLGIVGAIKYSDHLDYEHSQTLVGQCVSMPPYANAKVLGVKVKEIGRGRKLEYLMKLTEANGLVSMSDEPTAPILEMPVVECVPAPE